MISISGTAILLSAVVVLLIKTRWVRLSGAFVCVVFGLVLASTPVGPTITDAAGQVGTWGYTQLRSI